MVQQPDSLNTQHNTQHTQQTAEQQVTDREATESSLHSLNVAEDSTAQVVRAFKSQWEVKIDSVLMPEFGKSLKANVKPLPKYYKESFFSKDSLLHTELRAGRYGIAGDPVPYSFRNDDILTPLFIVVILALMFSISRAKQFLRFQASHFFRKIRTDSSIERETASQRKYLFFAEIYNSVVLTLMFYFYAQENISETYITYTEYTLLSIFLSCFAGFFLVQHLLQAAVDTVFFPPREHAQWNSAKLLTMTFFGLAMTPILLLLAFSSITVQDALISTLSVGVLVELLLFYKSFIIFFNKKGAYLHIFLYFCTLELVPILLLWGTLVTVANYLKVNY